MSDVYHCYELRAKKVTSIPLFLTIEDGHCQKMRQFFTASQEWNMKQIARKSY